MFTLIAFLFRWLAGKAELRAQKFDNYDHNYLIALNTRQDIRLLAFLVAGLMIEIGIIADFVFYDRYRPLLQKFGL